MCSESVAPRGKSYWLSRCNSKGVCGGFPLRGDEAVIGKAADADIRIDGDDYVSRRHARLVRSDGMLYVEDLQSANGTFLKIRRPIPLAAGDEIQIGNSIFRLRESEL
jgi:pSer/pThr/pTyr-binding forkhead associated (FHA) protein